MNHETRITQLEKQVIQLQKQLQAEGILCEWIPVSKSKKVLGLSSWVAKRRIKVDPQIKPGVHFRMNGNRYEINVSQWRKILSS